MSISTFLVSFYLYGFFSQKLQSWKDICRLFHMLAQFSFATNERGLDYYHQNVNVRVASRAAKLLKTLEN